MKTTHLRKNNSIQEIKTRTVEVFKSINKAKKHSRLNFKSHELEKAERFLPPLTAEKEDNEPTKRR